MFGRILWGVLVAGLMVALVSGGPSSGHALSAETDFTLATRAGDDVAKRTVTALTREQDAGLRAALRDPNKSRHVFDDPKHKLDPLVQ